MPASARDALRRAPRRDCRRGVRARSKRGSALLVLTDRRVDATRAPLPALLATAAVHHALIDARPPPARQPRRRHGRRARRAPGRRAVRVRRRPPSARTLGYDTVSRAGARPIRPAATRRSPRYRLALERGLLTIMSKMGVCTFSGYCGAQLFEILGLDASLVARFFPGTPSPLGGVDARRTSRRRSLARHARAFGAGCRRRWSIPGLHGYRRDGEYHADQSARRARAAEVRATSGAPTRPAAYDDVHVARATAARRTAVRDLLEFAPQRPPVPLDEVESVDDDLPALLRVGDVGRRALAGSAPRRSRSR